MRVQLGILALSLALIAGCAGSMSLSPETPGHMIADDSDSGAGFLWNSTQPDSLSCELRDHFDPPAEYKWYPDVLERNKVVVEEMYLTSTNGNQIFADVHRPKWASADMPCSALVLVPGGTQKGEVWHVPWRRSGSNHWAAAGFIVMDFDFQGRGKSQGVEDYYGPTHREDLKTVIEYCASRPDVLPGGVGLVSSSFGVTVCSCTLGAFPDLPARFFVDLEGAQDRHVATQFDDPVWIGYWGGHPTSDDEFWDEREAITYQPFIKSAYIRVQSDTDHAFDYFYVDHAIQMCNAALLGSSTYVQMNHNPPNQLLDELYEKTYQYEDLDIIDESLFMYVIEASVAEF